LQEPDSSGQPLVLEGLVLRPDCRPIAGAVIDIWHCDEHGRYDNVSFRYRGHQFTDTAGAFHFKTIRPGHYPGRTPHIHVKVQGEATRLLTTQLYFPDLQDTNAKDWIFRDDLMLRLDSISGGSRGRFDFVLAPS
jgi:protocatechuate 3,4-dioxygenase beta subunit